MPRKLRSDARSRIGCVHGNEKDYPAAEVYLTVAGQIFLMPVTLALKLPYAVMLDHDVPSLLEMVHNIKTNFSVNTQKKKYSAGQKVYLQAGSGISGPI